MHGNKLRNFSLLIVFLLLLTNFVIAQQTMANCSLHSVKGTLYINDEIAPPGIEILLIFYEGPGGTENTTTYEFNLYGDNTNYNLGFCDQAGQTGYFKILYQGYELYPEDNETVFIDPEIIAYHIDLHITMSGPENNPPDKPTTPFPANNSINVDLRPTLSISVSDPDDNVMDVYFYNASDQSLIDVVTNVASGTTASVTCPDLDYNTTYHWYAVANDSQLETKSDTWKFTTKKLPEPNHPPNAPENPTPKNNTTGVFINPTLYVNVTDPDNDQMNVSFYNATDDVLIGIASGVASGTTASVTWLDLDYNTTYHWYAVANDSSAENISDTWSFTTQSEPNTPPRVTITKPVLRSIYFRNNRIPRLLPRVLIIGWIDVEAEASDVEGVTKVEFYIDNVLKHTDYDAPYNWTWNEKAFFRHTIKVTAYDAEGVKASDSITVRVFNFQRQ